MVRFAGFVALCLVVGCGSETSGDDGGSGGEGGSGTTSATGASTMTTGQTAVQAPSLDSVEPMHGALHVFWTNNTVDCDTVEGERKVDDGAFEALFSVPGTVDNKMDSAATTTTSSYTYRVRCVKGGVASEYSNEVAGSPE